MTTPEYTEPTPDPSAHIAVSRASDAALVAALQRIFEHQPGLEASYADPLIRRRELLHDWPLSRVERLRFRPPFLSSTIVKACVPPMHSEAAVYTIVMRMSSDGQRWSPTLYGQYTPAGTSEQVWLFLEDVGNRRLSDEPTTANVEAAITILAQMHAAFTGEAQALATLSGLPVYDHARYLKLARQTYLTTKTLVEQGAYPAVDVARLDRLAQVRDMYAAVATELSAAPLTFVHGDFQPQNIMLTDSGIRLVDWANASFGVGLTDLVDLAAFVTTIMPTAYGYDPDTMRALLHRYYGIYTAAGGVPMSPESIETLFVACQMHKKLWQIHWFNQCALRWIPSGIPFYNVTIAAAIDDIYGLSTLFT